MNAIKKWTLASESGVEVRSGCCTSLFASFSLLLTLEGEFSLTIEPFPLSFGGEELK